MFQGCVCKNADTSDMADLAVLWRSIYFFVVPNWFLCTDAANDDTMIVLCSCGIPFKHLSMIPECVSNVHHLSLLPDFLVAVDLEMTLVASRLSLAMISRR